MDSPPVPASANRAARRHPEKMARGYCGIADAAAYLDVNPKTIRRLIAAQELQAYRLGNKIVRIKLADLDRLLTPVPGGVA